MCAHARPCAYARIPRTYNKRMFDSHQQEPVGCNQELPGTYVPLLFYEMTSSEYVRIIVLLYGPRWASSFLGTALGCYIIFLGATEGSQCFKDSNVS